MMSAAELCYKVNVLLWQSLRKIYASHVFFADLKSELFFGYKMQVRGAIRKAPTALGWVAALMDLKRNGYADAGQVVKSWNSQCSAGHHIGGHKAQAVKNLLEVPQEALSKIMACQSLLGNEDSPFTDENLSTKKIAPGLGTHLLACWKSATAWVCAVAFVLVSVFRL